MPALVALCSSEDDTIHGIKLNYVHENNIDYVITACILCLPCIYRIGLFDSTC